MEDTRGGIVVAREDIIEAGRVGMGAETPRAAVGTAARSVLLPRQDSNL